MVYELRTLHARCKCTCTTVTCQPRAFHIGGRVQGHFPLWTLMPGLPQAARRAAGMRRALPARRRILQLQQRVVRAARGPAQLRRVCRAQGGRQGWVGRRRVRPRRRDQLGVGAGQRAELAALAAPRQHDLRRAPKVCAALLCRAGQGFGGVTAPRMQTLCSAWPAHQVCMGCSQGAWSLLLRKHTIGQVHV